MKKYSFILFLLLACIEDDNHKAIDTTLVSPNLSEKTEITFQQLYNLHGNTIGKDTIITGYVISSDAKGNYYKEIVVQNTLGTSDESEQNPRMGLKVRVGIINSYTKYILGRKVAIHLEGLKRTTSKNMLSIGRPTGTYIGDILEFDLDHFILKFNEIGKLVPKTVALSKIDKNDLNTLIKVEQLHLKSSELGMTFSGMSTDEYDGKRTLEYCQGFRKDTIVMETSNFADFADKTLPNTQLNVTGIYQINFDNQPVLVLNALEDIEELGDYIDCEVKLPNILITEVADPENASFSRYVELYNAEDIELDLNGWNLSRFVNGGTEQKISLAEVIIPSKGFALIANEEASTANNFNFHDSFDFSPDVFSSWLDGNGDDAYSLTNEAGVVVDVYGRSTEDGTGSVWEYEDGRAYRNINIKKPSSVFRLEEWSVIKGKQNVPEDFSPGERKDSEVSFVSPAVKIETAPILITEVADPQQSTGARFVELYNPTASKVSFAQWTLVRYNYTSAKNTKDLAALPIFLDEIIIPAFGFLIVARDEMVFYDYFGVRAEVISFGLDGNGDDAYELIDPYGVVIDVYGDPTQDGSHSAWEYKDGFSKRKLSIIKPNKIFDVLEWEVQQFQIESKNFSPKIR